MTEPTPQQLLEAYQVHGEIYAIGPFFSDGVTILKQQIRALNLVFALAETRKIRNELNGLDAQESARTIAVIGGGVAGMTAAAAAAKLGNEVWHFEQRPELCHLQAGCDTRAVAPHIYDWPKGGSENPYAALPLLNWQAATAAELARCLITDYEAIQNEAGSHLQLHLGATTFVSGRKVKWDNSQGDDRGGCKEFDCIIIATGFGIERGVHDQRFLSYWRNDSLNQSTPGITSEKTEQVLISGTGDGGLIDLLRTKIRGFNQAWIIEDVFSEAPELNRLRKALEIIHEDCCNFDNTLEREATSLFGRFKALSHDNETAVELSKIKSRLSKRIRKDVSAILNGTDEVFSDVLRFGRASLSNAFLVFLLYELKAFNYVPGEVVKIDQKKVTIEYRAREPRKVDSKRKTGNPFLQALAGLLSKTIHPTPPALRMVRSDFEDHTSNNAVISSTYLVDEIIVRHGTERDKCLRTLGVLSSQDEVKAFSYRQGSQSSLTSKPTWSPGYWSRSTKDVLEGRGEGPKEFLPSPSQALASTFASTLSSILMNELGDSGFQEFRLTVHRLIQLRGENYYQQMSPYWGSRRAGEPSRIFNVDVGLVGLACRTGIPIVLKRGDNQTWKELWEILRAGHGTSIRTPRDSISSILAFPVFVQGPNNRFVSLVIYADSERPDIFVRGDDSSPILTRLFHAASGFVESCDHLQSKRVLRFARSTFWGIIPDPNRDAELIRALAAENALFRADERIEGFDYQPITANIPLHWDCIYRTYELATAGEVTNPIDYVI
jgi:hypothetical protein